MALKEPKDPNKEPQSESMKAPRVVADERPRTRPRIEPVIEPHNPEFGPDPDAEETGKVLVTDMGDGEKEESDLQRFECLQHDAIINGHKIAHGNVIEMTMHDVRKHRRHGVAISDPLPDDDERKVSVDVTQPFQPEQNEDTKPMADTD